MLRLFRTLQTLCLTMCMAVVIVACSSDDEMRHPTSSAELVQVTFSTSITQAPRPATRALQPVMGETWEHEMSDLWVLLMQKNSGGQWMLRYKFHFDASGIVNTLTSVDGILTQSSDVLPLSYTTSPKYVEAGVYYPLYLANVPVGSAMESALQSAVVSSSSVESLLRLLTTGGNGSAGLSEPAAYELRNPAERQRLLATNAFRMDGTTGQPVGQWPGFPGVQSLSLTGDDHVSVVLNRSVAKVRLWLKTTDAGGNGIPQADGFVLKAVNMLNVPTHGCQIWNTPSAVGAFGGYSSPDNALTDDVATVNSHWDSFPLLRQIHDQPIGTANHLDGSVPAMSYYLKADAEMDWHPSLVATPRMPATALQLVMSRAGKDETYEIPVIDPRSAYPFIMGNMLYDIHVTFSGPDVSYFITTAEAWTDETDETLTFE